MEKNYLRNLSYTLIIAGFGITVVLLIFHITLPSILYGLYGLIFLLFLSLAACIFQFQQQLKEDKKNLNQLEINFQKQIKAYSQEEKAKQKLEKALLQGQKLQAMGTLAGGIAHDFNNLLYAITGYVEMAREDVEKNSLLYSNLGKVLEASQRGQELIARILAFGRRQHHKLTRICIEDTIQNVLSLLKPTIPASVIIDYEIKLKNHCYIKGDQTQLHQVIVNIINNAVDAMDGEGKISITLDRAARTDELMEQFPKKFAEHYCMLAIKDEGRGIDQATIERIFEPFFTTKEVGKGTGLGLATVHAIIEEHKGHIIVKSELGHGTTFIVLIPEYI